MEPRFHTGDLAVVHPQSTYRVGEVTAHHNHMLHTVVLHRIVAIHGDRYTFKGDNNSWQDQERPSRNQLIGALVLRIPQGGVWLRRLTSAPLLGVLAFALLATGGASRRRKRKGSMARHAAPRRRSRASVTDGDSPTHTTAAVAALLGLGALTIGAWCLPATQRRAEKVPQTQTLTVAYHATVRRSPAYDNTTITSPQPVFRNVTDRITLQVGYHGAPGTLRVDAELSTAGGWTSTLHLAPAHSFDGHGYSIHLPFELAALDRRAQAAGHVTGLPATPVTVTVIPKITNQPGHTFAPQFPFTLTPLAFAPTSGGGKLTAASSTTETEMTVAPRDLHLLGHTLAMRTARDVTLAAFSLALLAAAGLLVVGRMRRAQGEADRIRRRWSELLLDVQPMPTPPGRPVVDVPTFTALVRLAERYELLILHWARSGIHTYLVQDDATLFRYRTGIPALNERSVADTVGEPVTPCTAPYEAESSARPAAVSGDERR